MPRRLATAIAAAFALIPIPAAAGAATAAPAATSVCSGISGCRTVASADIDGDGRADQVGIVNGYIDGVEGYAPRGNSTIHVRTATGRTMSTRTTGVTWYSTNAFFDIGSIDGRRGSEIIVGTRRGSLLGDVSASGDSRRAQWTEFRVITYRDGALTTLKSPVGDSSSGNVRWRVYEGDYPSVGFSRSTSGGQVYLRRTSAAPKAYPSKAWTSSQTTYRWANGSWARSTTRKSTVTEAVGRKLAWWHVAGVRSFSQCGDVQYTPQSDDIAQSIGTVGVGCTTAKSVVRAADYARWSNGTASVKGFRCAVYADWSGMASEIRTCRSGSTMIGWRRY